MRTILLLAGALALGLAAPARADVSYTFTDTLVQGSVVTQNGFTQDGSGFTGLPLTLTFTEAGIASGEVSGFESAGFPPTPTQVSGLSGFVGLSTFMDGATLGTLADSLSLDVRFDAAGAITAESIDFSGTDIAFVLTNGVAQVGSDGLLGCTALVGSGACVAGGGFVRAAAVPEPGALWLLLPALLALLLARAGTRGTGREAVRRLMDAARRRDGVRGMARHARRGAGAAGCVAAAALALLAPAARAQVAPSAFPASMQAALPQNLVARPLPLSAADPSGLGMRGVVLVMRHGVRPPTSTAKFQPFAAQPFPSNADWGAPDGNLTPNGALLAGAIGTIERTLYANKGLLSPSGCPAAGDLFVWADNSTQRTLATGNALVGGLYAGCGLLASSAPSGTVDPLFSPNFPLNTTAALAAVNARMGGGVAAVNAVMAPLYAQIGAVLQCCSASLCASSGVSAPCGFGDLPSSVTVSAGALSLNGPLSNGSGIAQVFELEYANGFTGFDLGFGSLGKAGVQALEQIYTLKYGFFERTPILAANKGSDIAQQVLDAVLAGAGQAVPGGPPAARMTTYVGHDSTLAALGGMLNLHWALPGYQSDDMPPGGTLGFEVLSDAAGAVYVRPVFIALTLDAMHAGVPRAIVTPPIYEALQLPGCDLDAGRLCTLGAFRALMTAAINPQAVGPAPY